MNPLLRSATSWLSSQCTTSRVLVSGSLRGSLSRCSALQRLSYTAPHRNHVPLPRYNSQQAPQATKTPTVTPSKPPPASPSPASHTVHVSQAEQRRKDWSIVKKLAENIWPKNDWSTRGRVILGLGLLITGKLLNVQVPLLFKQIIDTLNVDITAGSTVWIVAGSLIAGYGLARVGATLSGELLNAVFAKVGQSAVRKVARQTFEHLLNLDLRFHLSRQTGGLTRAIDRGTKCVCPANSAFWTGSNI